MKKIIFLCLSICWAFSSFAQVQESSIAAGHYKAKDGSTSIYLNIFDNGRASLLSGDPDDDLQIYANYTTLAEGIKLHTDLDKYPLFVYCKKSETVPSRKIRFVMDSSAESPSQLYMSLTNDKTKPEWVDIDSIYEENEREELHFDLDAKGKVLMVRFKKYGERCVFQYTVPEDANFIYINLNITDESKDMICEFLNLKKGTTSNHIQLSLEGENDVIDCYYIRPVNDSDSGKDYVPQVKEKSGYSTLNSDTFYVERKQRHDDDYESVSDEAPLVYFSDYQKALQIAQKENKMLRIYTYASKEDPCYLSIKNALDKNYESNYYYHESTNFLRNKYVLLLLAGDEAKAVEKYGVKKQPNCMFVSSDEHLLYSGKNECSEIYISEDSDPQKLYSALLMYYNNLVLEPQITKVKASDKKGLEKYMDNVFWVVDSLESFYNWHYFKENLAYDYPKLSIPSPEKISLYMGQYAESKMKSAPDTTLVKRIIKYESAFNSYESEGMMEVFSPTVRYFLQNVSAIRKTYSDPNELFNFIQQKLPPYNRYAEESDKLSSQTAIKLYKEAISLAPEYKDYFIINCWNYIEYEPDFGVAYDEGLTLMGEYFKDVLKAPSKKKYFNHLSHQMYELAPEYFSETFESEDSYFYPDENLEGQLHQKIALLLNNAAWKVYNYKENDKFLAQALQWSKLSMDMKTESKYIYQDTYAHLLYRTGKKDEAIKLQQEALQNGKEAESDENVLRQIRLDLKLMEMGLLGKEDEILEKL